MNSSYFDEICNRHMYVLLNRNLYMYLIVVVITYAVKQYELVIQIINYCFYILLIILSSREADSCRRTSTDERSSRPSPRPETRPQFAARHSVIAAATVQGHDVLVAVACLVRHKSSSLRSDATTSDSCKKQIQCIGCCQTTNTCRTTADLNIREVGLIEPPV